MNLFSRVFNRGFGSAAYSGAVELLPARGSFDTPPLSRLQDQPRLADVLRQLGREPRTVLLLWNWKSALLSIILRGPIFLIASLRRGWGATVSSLVTELIFCALTAGFYGTFVQLVRNAQPTWLTGLLITVVVPAAFQGLEYGLHWLRGTPHLRAAEIASVVAGALSALFNWYAMRRGALLVGGEGGNLGRDLARFPRLIVGFVVLAPRWVAGKFEPARAERETESK